MSNVPAEKLAEDAPGELLFTAEHCGDSTKAWLDTEKGTAGCGMSALAGFRYEKLTQSGGAPAGLFVTKRLRIAQGMTVEVRGGLPLILVATERVDIQGRLDASAKGARGVAGGPAGGDAGVAGGGSFCGRGAGGRKAQAGPRFVPLVGGSGGDSGYSPGGAGGGAVQLAAGVSIDVAATGIISVGGGGGHGFSPPPPGGTVASGGGSGGAILLEAPSVTIAGVLAANGGGGAGATTAKKAQDGLPSDKPARGASGGDGSAGARLDGRGGGVGGGGVIGNRMGGVTHVTTSGGGGGGAGAIRITTATGSATIAPGAIISPSLGTRCATQTVLACQAADRAGQRPSGDEGGAGGDR